MKLSFPSLVFCLLFVSSLAGRAATCGYNIVAPPGFSMIANHCDTAGNTLNDVLPLVPNGSRIHKFNKVTQSFDPPAIYNAGIWSPNPTLNPGEGAFFFNPTAAAVTLTIAGNPHPPVLPLILPPNGYCIVSMQTPVPGGFDNIIGLPPQDQDVVYRFFNPPGAYSIYVYDVNLGGWDPVAPIANVGESVWVCRGGSGAPPVVPEPEPCLAVTNQVITCLTNGKYSVTFSVVNQFTGTVYWLSVVDLPPGLQVNGQNNALIYLDPPLAPGAGTNVTLMLNYSGAVPTNLCFRLAVHNLALDECCSIVQCFKLPSCCAIITQECVTCDTNTPGRYKYSFLYQNVSGVPVKYVYLTPDANNPGCFPGQIVTLPTPLPNGASTMVMFIIDVSTNCGPRLCVRISGHQENFEECCAEVRCFTLPACCCGPRTYTLDTDFDLGTLVNLNHNPSHHQLQLNPVARPLPFVYIACSARGTAVRIDVNSGVVLGEFLTSPNGMGRDPSRTTVDKFGNCWVANRAESGLSGSPLQPKGSVVRIGLVLGGTRGRKDSSGNFVPDPTGDYLQGPFLYNTCVDRHGTTVTDPPDGLIKTSRGLGDIRTWSNAGSANTHGGVSTADDECITIYTRVNGAGTRFMGIDCDNNLWTGGLSDADFQKVDGVTGAPIAAFDFNIGCGGYGGLIDGLGTLWSAQTLMRFVPNSGSPPGAGACLPISCYGLGIDPRNCHIFASSGWVQTNGQSGLLEIDSAGNVLNVYPAINFGMGLCVDATGHVWVAQGSQVAHLAPNGGSHILVGYVGGMSHVRGVAVDSNGKIWAADLTGNSGHRINPGGGIIGGGGFNIGAIDLTVPLGTGAGPYNYSDMTGFVELAATCRSGFWDIVHNGCAPGTEWGVLSWNSLEPTNTSINVEVRAADLPGDLTTKPFKGVKNGVSFCGMGIIGKYLEIRVNFVGAPCSTNSPVLFDLTVDCCRRPNPCDRPGNHLPGVTRCPDPVRLCAATNATSVTVNVTVTDADGDPLAVTWRLGNNPPFETDNVPAGGPPTTATVGFTRTFPLGQSVVIMAIDDGSGRRDVCDIIITVGDKEPPVIQCPPGTNLIAFEGTVPIVRPVSLTDNCSPSNQIVVVQTPPPGTVVGVGSTPITLTATDAAGNSSSCQSFINVSPNVKLTSPTNYAVLPAPAAIPVAATVAPEAGPVRQVNFYQGSTLLGVVTNAPYRLVTQSLPVGNYAFRAVAINPSGRMALSDLVQVSVGSPGGTPVGGRPFLAAAREGNNLLLMLPTMPGVVCHIEYTDSLVTPDWKVLRTIQGDGTEFFLVEAVAGSPCRFYRVRME